MTADDDYAEDLRDWYAEDDAEAPPSQIHRGQARFAYRLTEHEADKLLHVHGIGWHHYDARRWQPDDRGKATRAVLADQRRAWKQAQSDKELAADVRRCESASGVNGTLELAAALEQFAATVKELDADPFLLNVDNGTLDLHTLKLLPHSPADRITKVCRGAYDPEAAAPVWDGFLARILPDEQVREFVQRVVGLSLLGEVREHVLVIFIGTGANGKGTFYKAVLYMLGDYASTADPNLFMHRDNAHPTGEMDLLGRRLIVVSESDEGRRLAEATMKRLTGGDPIKARHMRKDFVEFTPSHLPILVTNHLPRVSGDDPAIWRRIRVVPFNVVIPEDERDATLDSQLALEADGILSWAVAGLKDYLEHGLNEPDSVRVATADYQRKSDAVGRFITDQCHIAPALKATTGQLYEAWQRWQESDGCEPLGRGKFGEALDRRGYPADPAVHGKRWRQGIGIKAGEEFADE